MNIYIIIPTVDLTQGMINRSVNRKSENIRLSLDGTKSLLEVEQPVSSIYNDYQWYSCSEINEILLGAEWQN